MKVKPTSLSGVFTLEPEIKGDKRGYFCETFRASVINEVTGHHISFVQDNESRSSKGVLRGLHYQLAPFAQSKLVRVTEGVIWDIAVDIRVGSPTFGRWVAQELSSENRVQMFVPRGFAHGFVVLSDFATVAYKVDNYYSAEHDRGLAFDDSELNIPWPIQRSELLISAKDLNQPKLRELSESFSFRDDFYA